MRLSQDYASFVLPFPSSAIALRNDGNEQSTAGEEEEFSLRLDVGFAMRIPLHGPASIKMLWDVYGCRAMHSLRLRSRNAQGNHKVLSCISHEALIR